MLKIFKECQIEQIKDSKGNVKNYILSRDIAKILGYKNNIPMAKIADKVSLSAKGYNRKQYFVSEKSAILTILNCGKREVKEGLKVDLAELLVGFEEDNEVVTTEVTPSMGRIIDKEVEAPTYEEVLSHQQNEYIKDIKSGIEMDRSGLIEVFSRGMAKTPSVKQSFIDNELKAFNKFNNKIDYIKSNIQDIKNQHNRMVELNNKLKNTTLEIIEKIYIHDDYGVGAEYYLVGNNTFKDLTYSLNDLEFGYEILGRDIDIEDIGIENIEPDSLYMWNEEEVRKIMDIGVNSLISKDINKTRVNLLKHYSNKIEGNCYEYVDIYMDNISFSIDTEVALDVALGKTIDGSNIISYQEVLKFEKTLNKDFVCNRFKNVEDFMNFLNAKKLKSNTINDKVEVQNVVENVEEPKGNVIDVECEEIEEEKSKIDLLNLKPINGEDAIAVDCVDVKEDFGKPNGDTAQVKHVRMNPVNVEQEVNKDIIEKIKKEAEIYLSNLKPVNIEEGMKEANGDTVEVKHVRIDRTPINIKKREIKKQILREECKMEKRPLIDMEKTVFTEWTSKKQTQVYTYKDFMDKDDLPF